MENVIVVFPKPEDGRSIKNLLMRNGINVDIVCTSGSQALEYAHHLNGGLVVCSYRFTDMLYTELNDCMPDNFDMLLIASQGHWNEMENGTIIKVSMPIKVFDLINTIHMMFEAQQRRKKRLRQMPKIRSEEEKDIIKEAKDVLMNRNNMSEMEAHKYLQKCSMDSGNSIVETANMVICLYRE